MKKVKEETKEKYKKIRMKKEKGRKVGKMENRDNWEGKNWKKKRKGKYKTAEYKSKKEEN